MKFTIPPARPADTVEFTFSTDDGDLNIYINEMIVAYIDANDGKLHVVFADEPDELSALGFSVTGGQIDVVR